MDMVKNCLFCDFRNEKEHDIIAENGLFYARWDNFPVSMGHAEVVSKRHVESFFDMDKNEVESLYDLIKKVREIIDKKFSPHAYNIGVNDGEEAGRTIHHLHIHIIPRYRGDVKNPAGGIRNVIPGKGDHE